MPEKSTHNQILKSTGIIGGSQVVIIIIGIIRTKVLALILGPVGVGLAGLYQSVVNLVNMASSFGISFSAVREIALASGTNDQVKISTTILVLKRWAIVTGILGALVTIIFCIPISQFTFGSSSYAPAIALLSISVFLGIISSGQLALLQGLRMLELMAKVNILAALLGLLIAVPVYWYWGQTGIVPAILIGSLISFTLSWWYSKKVETVPVLLTIKDTFQEGRMMIKFGLFSVITGLVSLSTMYIVRAFIAKQGGVEGVGQFTAAWTISSMYMSAIFTAMAADYYPRLSSVSNDNAQVRKMVNEQTEIAILISAPIIIGMISFINIVVHLFYSSKFDLAATILNWQLAGDFFKVLSWPIGFIFLVKGKARQFIVSNVAWDALYLILVYVGWKFNGIESTGVAFLLAYLAVLLISYFMAKSTINFAWSSKCVLFIIVFLPLLILSTFSSIFLNGITQFFIGTIVTMAAMAFSYIQLKKLFDFNKIWARLRLR